MRGMSCLAYSSPGDPFKVLDVKPDSSLSEPLKKGQARVKMLYSPICAYDHRAIESEKSVKKNTKSVIAGREGEFERDSHEIEYVVVLFKCVRRLLASVTDDVTVCCSC